MITHRQKILFEKARLSRDARFDGKFFVAVKTTGIYCRPICPVKLPKSENIDFYLTAMEVSQAGFRPCLRCRPETAPNSPAWNGTSTTVNRALKLIADGFLNEHSVDALAEKLGVGERHLTRLCQQHIAISPIALAQYHRLQKAKILLNDTLLPMTQVAEMAGYKSVRRFNSHIKSVYSRTPNELRKQGKLKQTSPQNYLEFHLSYRPPYDWQKIMDFLSVRAAPGVEVIKENDQGDMSYHRIISIENELGLIDVFHHKDKHAIVCRIHEISGRRIFSCLERVKRLFDLNADLTQVHQQLKKDKVMAKQIKQNEGLRLPGCWHPFEIAVRAIIGQQVSVVGATTVLGRLIKMHGTPIDTTSKESLPLSLLAYAVSLGLTHQYPTPSSLSLIDTKTLSMPHARATAIKLMAEAVVSGDVDLSSCNSHENLMKQLLSINGIGPWTAQYVAMRALSYPDAFLSGDLVLQKHAARVYQFDKPRLTEKELLALAEKWRPWRAYASMILWNS